MYFDYYNNIFIKPKHYLCYHKRFMFDFNCSTSAITSIDLADYSVR